MASTIKDVAKSAGVSIATVSRVLNKSEKVKEETRTKILKAIADVGYKPSVIFGTQSVQAIRVFIPENSFEEFGPLFSGIREVAESSGYEAILYPVSENEKKGMSLYEEVFRKKTHGVITVTRWMDRNLCNEEYFEDIPTVKIFNGKLKLNGRNSDFNFDSVGVDSEIIISMAVNELIASEHKRILVISSDKSYICIEDTKNIVDNLNHENPGIEIEILKMSGKSSEELVSICRKKFYNCLGKYDGIICQTDLLAAALYKVLRENELNVPDDVSVIGMGNSSFSEYLLPSLSSISFPKEEIGRNAMKMLVERVENKKNENAVSRNMIFSATLNRRESIK